MLAWTRSVSPNVVNYNIHYGLTSGVYTNMVAVGEKLGEMAMLLVCIKCQQREILPVK